ncbi:hypothetical protein E2553_36065 [Paraburkholderia dipogonis]|uniref:Uncharacterized protein n=1 Tax=Paraburkholderia dipogonis TaxID=1211383 RepID=A0A4Y8MXB4_9BURK|nr:hypothetical protein [Paraburkholderia dipogonis]TFE42031.1 hypothetical protein E2553_36065 [Paraburkholderia dipogonis]
MGEDVRVRELMACLEKADPNAYVLAFPAYADPSDGDEVGEVLVPQDLWVHEHGTCVGTTYEAFLPATFAESDPAREVASRDHVRVVLIGPELGNFRVGSIWSHPSEAGDGQENSRDDAR